MSYSIEQRDSDLLNTSASIRYHCRFHRAAQHLICIEMEIDTTDKELKLVMPSWTPGSYKIREFVSHQGNLEVCDAADKPLSSTWLSKNILHINNDKQSPLVRVRYTYYANERTVRTMHINRWRAFVMPVNCMMYVQGRQAEIHHVYLHLEDTDWKVVSTALSPVDGSATYNTTRVVGALNFDILADSPIEIGNHQTTSFEACGAQHDVALVGPMELNIDWLSDQCKTIVETEAELFGGVPYDRYVFMVQVGSNVYGGLEHSRCSVNLIDITTMTEPGKAGRLLALLCHEYFHTWNIKRIRPREFGPFDYVNEVYSPMLWLAEGFTSYYDDLMSYRCGFLQHDEYIKNLGDEHLGRLDAVPGRFAMSTRDASFLAWVKLYAASPDGNNRHPSYYLKGGVITMLLEFSILAHTKGERRLDDVMRELWLMYEERPHLGLTEEEVYDAIHRATGFDARDMMIRLLDGTDEIDYTPYLEPLGLQWSMDDVSSENGVSAVFSGMSLKDENGKVVVSGVQDATPAQRAGLAVDDEIIAANSIRLNSSSSLSDILLKNWPDPVELLCSCDAKIYTTQLSAVPRRVPNLRIDPNATPAQRRLLDRWLER